MDLSTFDGLAEDEAKAELARCCGAARWVGAMLAERPFGTAERLFEAAERHWASMAREDILEAFTHHPKIGDLDALRAKFAATAQWASNEQAGTASASEEVLQGLSVGNHLYESRFGYIFIVCATGKSAPEMLALLTERLGNDPEHELSVAAREQGKITRLRLEKLLA